MRKEDADQDSVTVFGTRACASPGPIPQALTDANPDIREGATPRSAPSRLLTVSMTKGKHSIDFAKYCNDETCPTLVVAGGGGKLRESGAVVKGNVPDRRL